MERRYRLRDAQETPGERVDRELRRRRIDTVAQLTDEVAKDVAASVLAADALTRAVPVGEA